jgi:hypothetical protein
MPQRSWFIADRESLPAAYGLLFFWRCFNAI